MHPVAAPTATQPLVKTTGVRPDETNDSKRTWTRRDKVHFFELAPLHFKRRRASVDGPHPNFSRHLES